MKCINQVRCLLAIVAVTALSFSVTTVHANNTTHSLFGIDVSSQQGFVTWSSVYASGARFAFAKATEGTSITDADFGGNIIRGKSAGLQMGAYHFAYPAMTCPSAQANYFWSVAGPAIVADGKSINPAVAFEVINGTACVSNYTIWFNNFNTIVKSKTTAALNCEILVTPCNACNLNNTITLGPAIANFDLQNLYTGNPWDTCCNCNAWDPTGLCRSDAWDYFGATGSGAIPGVSGECDLDAFNGTLAELKAWQGI